MCSLKLTFAFSVSIFLLVNLKEAALTSQPRNGSTDIDLSDPEKLKLAFAHLSDNLIQLQDEVQQVKKEAKEEIQQVKREADQNIQQVEKEAKEEIQQVKKEAKEEIQQVKTEADQNIQQVEKEAKEEIQQVKKEADEKLLKFQEEVRVQIQEIKTEMQRNNKETLRQVSTIEQMASWFFPSGSGSSYGFRTPRRVETFGSANYFDLAELMALMSIPPSCYEWQKYGFKKTGNYLVDPDGAGTGEAPFTVYCNMESGYTVIHHDSEGGRRADSCSGPQCYTRTIHYGPSTQQILALMFRSDNCQQYIKIDCLESHLKKDGEALSTWTDREGREQGYWAGDGDSHTCACGLSKSCTDPKKSCHCDAIVEGVTLSDEGYLSNMTSLPVKSLQLGNPVDKPLQMNYTVGPLECYGSRPVSEPRSCRDLLISGHTSGYYFLNNDGSLDVTYCNMTEMYRKSLNDGETTRDHWDLTTVKQLRTALEEYKEHQQQSFNSSANNIFLETRNTIRQIKNELDEYKEHQVAFSAYANYYIVNRGSTIRFKTVTLNVGNGYDASTGIFTVPVAGLYYFSVHMQKDDVDIDFDFLLQKNGNLITGVWLKTVDVNDRIPGGISIVERLEVGDEIKVQLHKGRGAYGHKGVRFNGFLLK